MRYHGDRLTRVVSFFFNLVTCVYLAVCRFNLKSNSSGINGISSYESKYLKYKMICKSLEKSSFDQ